MSEKNLEAKTFFKQWLEKLQQESWQLELIISGFALFGIYSSKPMLIDLQEFAQNSQSNTFFNGLHFILEVGWRIFFINLLVHVVLRSLWIGAIGLRYVSGEIEFDDLNYSETFTDFLQKKVGDYDDFIENLEKICSVIFAYTFLLFLLFVSLMFFFLGLTFPFLVVDWLELDVDNDTLGGLITMCWMLPFFLFGLLVFVDFITTGVIKRIKDKTVSSFYMPIYRFYSFVTLSFLYRPLLYNFIDEKYTRRLFYFSVPYILIIAFGSNFIVNNFQPHIPRYSDALAKGIHIDDRYYDDLSTRSMVSKQDEEKKGSRRLMDFRLSGFYMDGPQATLFVKHLRRDPTTIQKKYDIKPQFKSGMHLSIFNRESQEDNDEEEQIEKSYQGKYETLMNAYRVVRDSIRREQLDTLIDRAAASRYFRLKAEPQALLDEKMNAIKEYRQSRDRMVLEKYESLFTMHIDSTDYRDSLTCFFSRHPNNGEKGLLCTFSTKSLSSGVHTVELTRYTGVSSKTKEFHKKRIKLPFVKI